MDRSLTGIPTYSRSTKQLLDKKLFLDKQDMSVYYGNGGTMMGKKKILLADDEQNITEILKAYLEKEDYEVFIADNGQQALDIFSAMVPDLLVLDLMMPVLTGEQVCRQIRRHSRVPIIMLTAKGSEEDLVKGIEMGADDYIVKPFRPREVIAKIKAVLRRSEADVLVSHPLAFGDLTIDFQNETVRRNAMPIKLTPTERKILITMARNPGRPYSRDQLIEFALDGDFDGYDRSIDTYIKSLRKKLEPDRHHPVHIKTIHGRGYQFES